jgi:hypothetical protein
MALEKMRTYYTPDEELLPPDENQRFEQEWSDPRTLAALGEDEGGLSALEATAGAFAKRKMDVPYALRKAIQDKTTIDPRATMEFIESGKQAPADKLPPVTPYPASRAFTPPRAQELAVNKQGLVGDLKPPVDMPETVPSLTMPSGVPAKTSDLAALQKLMSPGSLASPIPVASAPVKADVPGALKGAIPATTPTQPAPPADGSGGDEMSSLRKQLGIQQMFEALGSAGSGKNLYTDGGILADRMKQIEALRAKKLERQEGLEVERSQNEQTLNAYQAQFPELRETLEPLRGQTGKPAFQGLLRDIIATRKAATGERALDLREKGQQDTAGYRTDTLNLKRDIAKDNEKYRAVQAGLQKAALDLRRAENERKAVGGTEPSTKERGAFQTMMKPAEQTAVALKDADNLNALSTGMLVSGKPPPFLTQSDILSFVGVPPFENAMRSQLAKSNPQAFDLLTQMARLKTMVGHEYFGSALSPAEAERQRQFLDFGVTDTPESVARKMKSYHDSLADKASIFLRPRVVNSPLGAEWTQLSGLDVLSGEGGTFAGLLAAPAPVAPRVVSAAPQPSAIPAPVAPVKTNESAAVAKKPPSARSIEVLKQNPDAMTRQQFDERFGPGAASAALGE